ncbi:MAG: hypothetical protein FWF35_00680 [Elusimicrobia bacterium]|nr:hypothetical protein [Elusimicrobiota bacterium]
MKILRGYILLFACAVMLGGCGLDIGQIYIQIKKAGGWQQVAEDIQEARQTRYSTEVLNSANSVVTQPSSSQNALGQLDDSQKTRVDIIRNIYGDAAAGEAAAEYAAENAEFKAAAVSAKNDKDFYTKQQQIISKHNANVNAITLKYRK